MEVRYFLRLPRVVNSTSRLHYDSFAVGLTFFYEKFTNVCKLKIKVIGTSLPQGLEASSSRGAAVLLHYYRFYSNLYDLYMWRVLLTKFKKRSFYVQQYFLLFEKVYSQGPIVAKSESDVGMP